MSGQGDEGDAQKIRAVIVEEKERYIKTLEELAEERKRINTLQKEANDARESMCAVVNAPDAPKRWCCSC